MSRRKEDLSYMTGRIIKGKGKTCSDIFSTASVSKFLSQLTHYSNAHIEYCLLYL